MAVEMELVVPAVLKLSAEEEASEKHGDGAAYILYLL